MEEIGRDQGKQREAPNLHGMKGAIMVMPNILAVKVGSFGLSGSRRVCVHREIRRQSHFCSLCRSLAFGHLVSDKLSD